MKKTNKRFVFHSIQENGAKLQAYWTLIEKLPKPNRDNLRYPHIGKFEAFTFSDRPSIRFIIFDVSTACFAGI